MVVAPAWCVDEEGGGSAVALCTLLIPPGWLVCGFDHVPPRWW